MKANAFWIAAGAIALLAFGGGVAIAETSTSEPAAPAPPDPAVVDSFDVFAGGMVSTITTDPNTWPYSDSDPIGAACNATAHAEGYNKPGSNPFRLNNPGDISDGFHTYGGEAHSGSNVTHFPDAIIGWQWLYEKWSNGINGNSEVYSPDMTWDQWAKEWAGNWQAWSANVTLYLNVRRTDRVGDYFGV